MLQTRWTWKLTKEKLALKSKNKKVSENKKKYLLKPSMKVKKDVRCTYKKKHKNRIKMS